MQKLDFSGTWDILQMLKNTLYFHYMRYRTNPMTQNRGLEVEKLDFGQKNFPRG